MPEIEWRAAGTNNHRKKAYKHRNMYDKLKKKKWGNFKASKIGQKDHII